MAFEQLFPLLKTACFVAPDAQYNFIQLRALHFRKSGFPTNRMGKFADVCFLFLIAFWLDVL